MQIERIVDYILGAGSARLDAVGVVAADHRLASQAGICEHAVVGA